MKGWTLLRKIFPKDIVRMILQHIYPFKFETFWLRNERCNMLKEYSKKNINMFMEIIENTKSDTISCIPSFLHQYHHEAGEYYTDTYDCSYYTVKGDEICDCGECGGTMSAIWCEYRTWGKKWDIDHHMDRYGKMSSLEISNEYYQDFDQYQLKIHEKRMRLCERLPKLIKF